MNFYTPWYNKMLSPYQTAKISFNIAGLKKHRNIQILGRYQPVFRSQRVSYKAMAGNAGRAGDCIFLGQL